MPKREIWASNEAFYIHSMLTCTASALTSVERVAGVIKALSGKEVTRADIDDDSILDEVQNAVLQAAALSRFFWPSRVAHNWRGEILRSAFSVDDSSALKNRDLRNAIVTRGSLPNAVLAFVDGGEEHRVEVQRPLPR